MSISGPTAQSKDHELVKRILAEFSNYHMHGELYTFDNALSVSLPTQNTFVVSTGWTAGKSTGTDYVVLDAANGTITIGDKGKGLYYIKANMSFRSNKVNSAAHGSIFLNGTEQQNLSLRRNIAVANRIGNANTQNGFLSLVPDDVIDFRLESDVNSTTIVIEHGGFSILWMAGE